MELEKAAIFEHLRKLFLLEIANADDEEIIYRSSIDNEDDILNFVKEYERVSSTNFIVYCEIGNPQKTVYHKKWVCESKQNENCRASIDVLIKKVNPGTVKNDPFLTRSPPLPCIIKIKHKHSHRVSVSADELRRLRVDYESNAGNSVSDVPDKAESILPDVPNLAIVKKEPVDDTEDIHPSTSGISSLPGSSNFVPSTVKMEFTTSEDCMDDMTIPVNPDDVPPPVATTRAVKSYSMSLMCSDSREPSPKRPNLSQSPPISGAEIKDEFSIFGNYVADKIRSFTDRRLQVEAQHRITNLLFEMEMKGLNEDSLPVISKISSLPKSSPVKVELSSSLATGEISSSQKTLPTKVTLLSKSTISKISSLPETLPTKVMQSSSSAISKISSLQTQISATVEVPSCSPIRIANLQTFPVISTLPSSSVVNTTSNLQSQFPTAVMLPSNMPISTVSSLKAQVPATVTSSSSSSICRVSSLQSQVPATETLPSSSPISTVTDLQEQKSTAVPSSMPISIASNLQTELPTTGILPSSSVIPFTSGNTIDLNTQVRPDVPKQT